MRIRSLHSINDLRQAAPAWDDLWWRSGVTWPTARAEMVAMWLEQFAPQTPFRAVAVEDQGQLVAVLPLIESRMARYVRAGVFPSSEWAPSGEFLLDPASDVDRVLDLLVRELACGPWPLIVVQSAIFDAPRWARLQMALERAAVSSVCQFKYFAGLVPVCGSWEAYRETWSRNHRRKTERLDRQLRQAGEAQFRLAALQDPSEVEPLLERGFEVENRCWKGTEGTSILRAPAIRDFYLRQGRQLAAWGQLELSFLELDGRAIAFEYGWAAKGVHHAFKIGYDEAFAQCSPGQLLFYHLLKEFHDAGQHRALNCLGPLNRAIQSWRPAAFRVGRLIMGPGRLGRIMLSVYQHMRRRRNSPEDISCAPCHADGTPTPLTSPDFADQLRT